MLGNSKHIKHNQHIQHIKHIQKCEIWMLLKDKILNYWRKKKTDTDGRTEGWMDLGTDGRNG